MIFSTNIITFLARLIIVNPNQKQRHKLALSSCIGRTTSQTWAYHIQVPRLKTRQNQIVTPAEVSAKVSDAQLVVRSNPYYFAFLGQILHEV